MMTVTSVEMVVIWCVVIFVRRLVQIVLLISFHLDFSIYVYVPNVLVWSIFPNRRSIANATYLHYRAFLLPLLGSVANVLPWNTNESLDAGSVMLAR
jgi:hypothetical protein